MYKKQVIAVRKTFIKYIFAAVAGVLIIFASIVSLLLLNGDFFSSVAKKFSEPSRYSISGSDFDGNWIVDNKYSVTLEDDGQAIVIDGNFIYSYGKSGYICLRDDDPLIKVYCDEHTEKEALAKWARQKNTYKDQLVVTDTMNDLLPQEKKYYYELKDKHMKYPFRY